MTTATSAGKMETGFISMFLNVARTTPDAPALTLLDADYAEQTRWSYRDLLLLMERYRKVFVSLGVQPGDPVALQLPSGPELIACVYALTSIGAIFAPVNPKPTRYELESILSDLKPAAVVTTPQLVRDCLGALSAVQTWPRFVLLTGALPKHLHRPKGLHIVAETEIPAGGSPLEPPSGNPVVSCHHTFKGLGYPLGVPHRYHDYTPCIAAFMERFPEEHGAPFLVGLPLHLIYSLTAGLFSPFSVGSHVLLSQKPHELDLIGTLEQYQVQMACLVPLLLKMLAARARNRIRQGRRLQFHPLFKIASGGSLMDRALAAEVCSATGVEVYQGYGLTETLPVLGTFPGRNKPGALGVPFSEVVEVAVFGQDGRAVSDGVAGELCVRGPSVTEGFWRRPEETSSFLRDGWFHTGDLAFRDEEGYFHYLGRSYPFAKIASQMVDLVEVEATLRRNPAVARAMVTVTRHADRGEGLAASVILKPGSQATAKELKDTCKKFLSPHKVPREFMIYENNVATVGAR
jgi:Acyl-CoA synthetases (AMP-forming)/AMP-acid ligases II